MGQTILVVPEEDEATGDLITTTYVIDPNSRLVQTKKWVEGSDGQSKIWVEDIEGVRETIISPDGTRELRDYGPGTTTGTIDEATPLKTVTLVGGARLSDLPAVFYVPDGAVIYRLDQGTMLETVTVDGFTQQQFF